MPSKVQTAQELIEAQFGVKVDVSLVSVTVGTSQVAIVGNNPNRVGLVIMNLSGNDVYVSPFSGVSTTNGLKLATSGGNITLNWQFDLTLCTYGFNAIANTGSNAVMVMEVFTVNQGVAGGSGG